MPIKKRNVRKFTIVFYSICFLCVALMLATHFIFEYIEFDLAIDWTVKYFALPILLIMAATSYYMYFAYIIQREKRQYASKFWTNLRSIFRIITLTFGLSLGCCGAVMALMFLTNAYPYCGRPIMINDKIVDVHSSENRGRTNYFIEISDKRFNRQIEFEVGPAYHVGDTFTKKMEVGRWGMLYKIKD